MNKDKQRIAIAEACGLSTKQEQLGGVLIYRDKRGYPVPALPNYPADLNAMHEAEKVLTVSQCWRYNEELDKVLGIFAGMGAGDLPEWKWHSTAAQRAEAFLRTIGKWEEA